MKKWSFNSSIIAAKKVLAKLADTILYALIIQLK
jgi:hypothetical protein